MAIVSMLRKQPTMENLPALFSIQRMLNLHSDILSALPFCVQKIQEILPESEVIIGIAQNLKGEIRIMAAAPDTTFEKYKNVSISMGKFPCGMALEKEELVAASLDDQRFFMETPICSEKQPIGALSVLFESTIPELQQARATELIQWTCFLLEEAFGLRRAMSRQMGQSDQAIFSELQRKSSTVPLTRPKPKADSLGDKTIEEISFHGIIGTSDRMKEVFTLINHVAGTEATVLVTGESGTGKELAAKAIHECSKRSGGPFVAVNCSALPESIIESELFGHEKGSFTGAIASRLGRFEAARDGTLFLDEIGDLTPAVQVKLLRILQERSFERVGGNKAIKTNARIIAATHCDLQKEVKEGRFREDLFFRLNVFPIHLPPLRERSADILLLADYFVEKTNASTGKEIKRISSPALDLLMIYHWPGNVRELENCIARAAIISTDGVIHSYNLPPSLQSATSTGTEPTATLDGAIARLEKEMLIEALKIERGNSASAARRLGTTERRFRLALQRYKIDYRSFRTKM